VRKYYTEHIGQFELIGIQELHKFQRSFLYNSIHKRKRSLEFCSQVMGYPIDKLESALNSIGYYEDNHGWCSKCAILKPLSEFSISTTLKCGHHYWCKECDNAGTKQYKLDNHEKHLEYCKTHYHKNKEQCAAYGKQYRKDNPDKIAQYGLKQRTNYKQATACWADLDKLKQIYLERDRLTEETGIRHNVDHVIPLNGKNVCGLHVETNLQILTETENKSKSNKFEPIIESFK